MLFANLSIGQIIDVLLDEANGLLFRKVECRDVILCPPRGHFPNYGSDCLMLAVHSLTVLSGGVGAWVPLAFWDGVRRFGVPVLA